MQTETLTGVLLDTDGAPLSFHYLGKSFLVCSKPVRWYSRKLWWEAAGSASKGSGQAILEVEMWRLWASDSSSRLFFELRHQSPEDIWEISEVS
jgi:hypothetical protein